MPRFPRRSDVPGRNLKISLIAGRANQPSIPPREERHGKCVTSSMIYTTWESATLRMELDRSLIVRSIAKLLITIASPSIQVAGEYIWIFSLPTRKQPNNIIPSPANFISVSSVYISLADVIPLSVVNTRSSILLVNAASL
ncbi:hypothetical protein AAP_00985 [Ascosphaera apis ARSEF 7405]|uniref:Uncharacterized protein n=1 Tax=Ascosphaera apis ARSEF 7405 TaxID=392613 RepID=A0A162IMK3_9EURO|nr:hypothetical protein AAP_00985 [Ascosphaera apis ARSEF 7405]